MQRWWLEQEEDLTKIQRNSRSQRYLHTPTTRFLENLNFRLNPIASLSHTRENLYLHYDKFTISLDSVRFPYTAATSLVQSLTFRPCSHAQKGNAFYGNHPVPGGSALEYRPPAFSRESAFVDQQTYFGSIFKFFPP